jgi:hypothetical protein
MDSGKRDLEPGFIFQRCMTDEWTLDHTETYLKRKKNLIIYSEFEFSGLI